MKHYLSATAICIPIPVLILLYSVLCLRAQAEIPAMTAYFPLDETGTEVVDVINNTKGTLAKGSNWITGKIGGAMAVKSGTHISHHAAFDFAEESFSIAFWMREVKGGTARHPHPLSKGDYSTSELAKGVRWEFHAERGNFYFTIDDGTNKVEAFDPKETFFTGEWIHVTGVRDREQKKLLIYADGELKGTVDDAAGSIANPVDLVIGDASRDDNHFPGDLDDIRFFRLALTESQIKEIMSVNQSTTGLKGLTGTPGGEKSILFIGGIRAISRENNYLHSIEATNLLGQVLRISPASSTAPNNIKDKAHHRAESGIYVKYFRGLK